MASKIIKLNLSLKTKIELSLKKTTFGSLNIIEKRLHIIPKYININTIITRDNTQNMQTIKTSSLSRTETFV